MFLNAKHSFLCNFMARQTSPLFVPNYFPISYLKVVELLSGRWCYFSKLKIQVALSRCVCLRDNLPPFPLIPGSEWPSYKVVIIISARMQSIRTTRHNDCPVMLHCKCLDEQLIWIIVSNCVYETEWKQSQTLRLTSFVRWRSSGNIGTNHKIWYSD